MPDDDRKLVTVLAVDCVGYSAAAERDQAGAAQRIAALRARLDALAQQQGGRIFSTAGDGFMLEFPLASGAVRAATALLSEAVKPDSGLPRVRAGAHLGEVLIVGDDLLGHGVNVAARLCALAEPNGLVVSEALKAQLRGEIDIAFVPMGDVRLSKMRETVEAHAFVAAPSSLPPWARRARDLIRRHRRASAAAAIVLLAAIGAGTWLTTRSFNYVVDSVDLIVQSEREENMPALTPDGRTVVYAADVGASRWNNTDLFMRRLDSADSIQLTDTPDMVEYAPAVSPSGDRLAYVRNTGVHLRRPEDRCQIMLRTFPDGVDRHIGTCDGVGAVWRLSWTPDGRGLVYSDFPSGQGSAPHRIRLLEIETGRVRDLVPPLEQGNGDHNAVVSPDGRKVAFVRYSSEIGGDVCIYDLRTGRLTRIIRGEEWAQLDWASDQELFVLFARGSGAELWLYNANGSNGRRLLPAMGRLARLDYAAGVLVAEVLTESQNLIRHGTDGASRLAGGFQADHSADFSKDGALAFVRAPGWLYLQQPGEEPRRFVSLNGDYARDLRWSPDGRRIAYASVVEGASRLFIVDATSGVITSVSTPPQHDPNNPAWTLDGNALLYSDGGWLRRVPLDGGSAETLSEAPDWDVVVDTPRGILGTRLFIEPGLWRAPAEGDAVLVHDAYRVHLPKVGDRDWALVNDVVYSIEIDSNQQRRVVAAPLGSADARTVSVVDGEFAGSMAVDPRTGDVVYSIATSRQADIGLVRLRRQ